MGNLTTGYALSLNDELRGLVTAAIAKASNDIINDQGSYTAEEITWAKASIKDPETPALQMLWIVLQNQTILDAGTNFSENDIQFVVNSNWRSLV